MSVEAMQPIAISDAIAAPSLAKETANIGGDFATWLQREISDVNHQLVQADSDVRKLATGQAENLHQVMLSLDKARVSLELVVQVRNRMLDTYQDLMRMSI